MIDERSKHYRLPLPQRQNALTLDVDRLRDTIRSIDAILKSIADGGTGSVTYAGVWDAASNTPSIPPAASENKGHYYVVSVAGSTKIDGTDRWQADDWIVSNGTVWQRLANLTSFNPGDYMLRLGGEFDGPVSTEAVYSKMAKDDDRAPFVVRGGLGPFSGPTDDFNALIGFQYRETQGIKMGCRVDGTFGIGGWSSNPWRWYSTADGDMVSAGNVGAYSDPRLKDGVERIGCALSIIERLDGVRFTWNSRTKLIGRPGRRDIGVLADQVEAVLPEAVTRSVPDDENGGERWRVVAYDKLIPVLIEAVKELSNRVKRLEGK